MDLSICQNLCFTYLPFLVFACWGTVSNCLEILVQEMVQKSHYDEERGRYDIKDVMPLIVILSSTTSLLEVLMSVVFLSICMEIQNWEEVHG